MHIMMVANDTTFIYNLRKEILERFVQEGYSVTVVCEVLSFREELEALGCRLIDVKNHRRGTNPLSDLKLAYTYFNILKKERPDVVLTNNIKPNIYAGMACQILGIKRICNITGLGTAVESAGILQKLTVFLYRIGVRNAECILFQNAENEAFFKRHNLISPKSNVVRLAGSGVNLKTHELQPYPEGECVHFLFAARIMKEKGIDLFLAAAQKYHSKNVVFDICGACDDEKYKEILRQAHEKGVVHYHGQQKFMQPFYAKCSCFLFPSYYPEGMSNVLLEAAACGRPAIAADRSGCRETVTDGVTGFIVPVNDEAAVLDAVGRFLSLTWEQRRDMGLAARAKIEKEFDRQIVVGKYIEQVNLLLDMVRICN